jgi:hypothetical protein
MEKQLKSIMQVPSKVHEKVHCKYFEKVQSKIHGKVTQKYFFKQVGQLEPSKTTGGKEVVGFFPERIKLF